MELCSADLRAVFLDKSCVSISIETKGEKGTEPYAEALLLAVFLARQLTTVTDEAADRLARNLASSACDPQDMDGPTLVPSVSRRRGKMFTCHVNTLPNSAKPFDDSVSGFGLLGSTSSYYAPVAALALLRFLAIRRSSDNTYVQRIGAVAWLTAQMHFRGMLNLRNWYSQANGTAAIVFTDDFTTELPVLREEMRSLSKG